MKILVISDSHGSKDAILDAIAMESPELILHLGDHDKDCAVIETEYPGIPLRSIRGNCDRTSAGFDADEFRLENKLFYMTHGHLYHVKFSKASLIKMAADRGVDVLLFGHTHIPYYSLNGTLSIINPGSIGSTEKSYAVLELKNGVVSCELKSNMF